MAFGELRARSAPAAAGIASGRGPAAQPGGRRSRRCDRPARPGREPAACAAEALHQLRRLARARRDTQPPRALRHAADRGNRRRRRDLDVQREVLGDPAAGVKWVLLGTSLLVGVALAVDGFLNLGERWRHYRIAPKDSRARTGASSRAPSPTGARTSRRTHARSLAASRSSSTRRPAGTSMVRHGPRRHRRPVPEARPVRLPVRLPVRRSVRGEPRAAGHRRTHGARRFDEPRQIAA